MLALKSSKSSPTTDYRRRLMLGDLLGPAVYPPAWFPRSYQRFHAIVTDPAYPCYLGSAAERRGELYYTFSDASTRPLLARTLQHFLALARLAPKERRNLTVFFPPDDVPLASSQYRQRFWATLQALHEADSSPWPDRVAMDSDCPYWEFCFAGEPIFVFCAAPSYRVRSSRNLGPGMIMLMQPRSSFFGIDGGDRAAIEARNKTRERLAKWDHMLPHPDLGIYGNPTNREWKQYVLPDSNAPVTGRCPFAAKDPKGPPR